MASDFVAELLRREGALPAEDVIRWLPDACDSLARLAAVGVVSTIDATSLRVSREGEPVLVEPRPFSVSPPDQSRAQVKALAALAWEMLKGAPPPEPPPGDAWIGVRPELARVLGPALVGQGAADATSLGRQLRELGRGDTAHLIKGEPHDTTLSGPKASAELERAGELLGPYELVRRLGQGGMGEVYLARHVRLAREVAVKLLKRELVKIPELVQRFFQEARIVNEINHPHIVQILDFVEEPERVYFVMELLQGRTLADLDRDEGPLAVSRVCGLMAQVCDALDGAHSRGVVHRDVKPENLFITQLPDGSEFIKVLDFGIARRSVPSEASRTQHGQVLGTPSYMSPEQAAGRLVDARSDLYSLGVTMYELFARRVSEAPQRLAETSRGERLPPAVSDLVESCLQLDPSKRPDSARAVRRVLEAAVNVLATVVAPTPGLVAPLDARAVGSHAWRRWAVAAVGLAAVVGVGLVANTHPPASRAATPVELTAAPSTTNQLPETRDTLPHIDAPAPPVSPPETAPTRVSAPTVGPPRHPVAERAPPIEPRPESTVRADVTRRVTALRQRYQALVQRHGEGQLTSLERASYQAALEEAASGGELAVPTLSGAETALDAAETRLGR